MTMSQQTNITSLRNRLSGWHLSVSAWLTGSAARISRITSDAGFWLWVYLIGVVFAVIGIYATLAWLFED